MALIPPFFFDCVTAIGFKEQNGNVSFQATGFLFGRLASTGSTPEQNRYWVYLVTNRHVFEGKDIAILRFNPSTGSPAQTYDLDLVDKSGAPNYTLHTDPDIDIAVIKINVQFLKDQNIQYAFFYEDQHTMLVQQAHLNGIAEGDGIFILGFPMGEVGRDRNYVVARQGCIARLRDVVALTNKYLLVDATVFPGNSGGPVISKPEMVAIQGTSTHNAASLIGIVAGYLPYQDVAISAQTKKPCIIFEENSGLAVVFPVDRIIEVVNLALAKIQQLQTPTAGSQP